MKGSFVNFEKMWADLYKLYPAVEAELRTAFKAARIKYGNSEKELAADPDMELRINLGNFPPHILFAVEEKIRLTPIVFERTSIVLADIVTAVANKYHLQVKRSSGTLSYYLKLNYKDYGGNN